MFLSIQKNSEIVVTYWQNKVLEWRQLILVLVNPVLQLNNTFLIKRSFICTHSKTDVRPLCQKTISPGNKKCNFRNTRNLVMCKFTTVTELPTIEN